MWSRLGELAVNVGPWFVFGVLGLFLVWAFFLARMVLTACDAKPTSRDVSCVVHVIRNAMRFVSYGDRKKIAKAMKEIYTAPTLEAAELGLAEFDKQFGAQYPGTVDVWRNAWEEFVPFLGLVELSLRWLLGQPGVGSLLLGGSRVEQLHSNIAAAAAGPLPDDVRAACDEVGADLRGPMPAYNR